MRLFRHLMLTALLGAALAAPGWAGHDAYRAAFDRDEAKTLVASSRHSGKHFHGQRHHFGHPSHFAPHHRRHDHFFGRHDRRFHDDFFFGRHDRRFHDPFFHRPHHRFPHQGHLSPHDRVTVCFRSEGVLFCYRSFH